MRFGHGSTADPWRATHRVGHAVSNTRLVVQVRIAAGDMHGAVEDLVGSFVLASTMQLEQPAECVFCATTGFVPS